MANPYQGEVALTIDGQVLTCKLTLGALADLEQALKSGSLMDLITRFDAQDFSASDILHVVTAGLRGGGWDGKVDDVRHADIGGGPMAAARAAAQLLTLAFQVPD
ncbi:MAG: gene transfer agent family protein [Pseudomonadota bacterium]